METSKLSPFFYPPKKSSSTPSLNNYDASQSRNDTAPLWQVLHLPVQRECLQHPRKVRNVVEEFPEENANFLKTKEGKDFKTILVWNYVS